MKKLLLFFVLVLAFVSCESPESKKKINDLTNQVSILLKENQELVEKIKEMETTQVSSNMRVEGRWKDTRAGSGIVFTLKKDLDSNKYYLFEEFSDGSKVNYEVRMSKFEGMRRFDIIGWEQPEFFVIQTDGDLGMYSQNRKFATALSF